MIHLTRFSGRASAVLGEIPDGTKPFRLERQRLDGHSRHDPQAPAKSGVSSQKSPQIRSGAFTPERIIASFSQRTEFEHFAIRHDHLGAQDTSVGKPDPVAQRRPSVADQIGDSRSLCAAAADDHIGPVFHAFFLNRRIDHAGAHLDIEVFFIQHEIIHSFQIDQQSAFHVGMRAGPIKSGAVRHIGNVVAVTDLNDLLNFFGCSGHDDASGDLCHDTFISQAAFISSGTASVALADNRIIGDILGADNGLQHAVNFFGYCHGLPPYA